MQAASLSSSLPVWLKDLYVYFCICVYMYIYMCTRICIHICTYTYEHITMYKHICTYTYAVCIYILHTHMHIHICTYTLHIHMYIHICTYTYIHAHMCIHICGLLLFRGSCLALVSVPVSIYICVDVGECLCMCVSDHVRMTA